MVKDWHHQILKYLFEHYSPQKKELNDFVIEKLNVDSKDLESAKHLDRILTSMMSDDNYIEYRKYAKGESRQDKDNVSHVGEAHERRLPGDIDHYSFQARLTLNGYRYISDEIRQERQDNLLERQTISTESTNKSVRQNNDRSLLLASISVLFICLSYVQQCKDPVPQKLEGIREQLLSTKKSLDSLLIFQQGIDSATRQIADSLKN